MTAQTRAFGQIFEPVLFRYDGHDADQHELDLFDFGTSAQGIARIIGPLSELALNGKLIRSRKALNVRVLIRSPEPACFQFWAFIVALGTLPLFSGAGTKLLELLLNSVLAKLAQKPAVANEMNQQLLELVKDKDEHQRAMLDRMLGVLEANAEAFRAAAKQVVTPIGTSCQTISIGGQSHKPLVLGPVDREVIDAGPEAEITDERNFEVVITELDVETGGCKLSIGDATEARVRGLISDPVLSQPDNSYALALANQKPLKVRAKALLKSGEIQKLFISDTGRPERLRPER